MSECVLPRRLTLPDVQSFDVCIAGGGPSGAALALRLAQLGKTVAIVEKATFPRRHIGESLTGGLMPLLEVLGLRSEIEGAGFIASEWATVCWAGENRQVRLHGGGLQVDRADFDEILLRAARATAGVVVYQPSDITAWTYENGGWQIRLDSGEVLRARYLADAAGRSRILGGTKERGGIPTLAVYAYWKGIGSLAGGDTLVEAGTSAWYWGAPLPGGDFNACVFLEPGARLDAEAYGALLEQSGLIGPLIRKASLCSQVRVCDATPYSDQTPVTCCSIKTGDAALSIDPLSSQGVQTAIGISLHAAVALNTMMEAPQDAELAMEFYRSRLRDSAAFHAAAAAGFYREQYAKCASEFWKARALYIPEGSIENQTVRFPSPETVVRLAPLAVFCSVAVVKGCRIVAEAGVRFKSSTFVYVGEGVLVAALLRGAGCPATASNIVRRWSRMMPSDEALRTLAWVWAKGLIEPTA